jgi:hypothetical protein
MRRLPRSHLVVLLLASVAVPGCPSDSPADGDDDGTDDGTGQPQVCAEPGSDLLDNTKPAPLPSADSPAFSCSTGWATDAPPRDPAWTLEIPFTTSEYGSLGGVLAVHPDGGVVVAGSGLFARYDADGVQLWTVAGAVGQDAQVYLVVEASGSIVLSVYDWVDDSSSIRRYAADGTSMGVVAIPWNDPSYGQVWGLETNGDELVVGAFDIDAQGSWEATLLRLDADDNLLLRKSTNMTNSGQLAVNDAGTAVFGNFPSFLLALENGAVLGTLAPSQGGMTDVVGYGADFVVAGVTAGLNNGGSDFSVGRYSSAGAERWLQTYDRATLSDNSRAIAAGSDGSIVAVGSTSLLETGNVYWYSSQPWVVGVDGDGNATWSDRISAVGEATSAGIGSQGEVYVLGIAEGLDIDPMFGGPNRVAWLRKY